MKNIASKIGDGRDKKDGGSLSIPSDGTQAVARALTVLSTFMGNEPELGISQIAEAVHLTQSTVHRLVQALARNGYLEQNPRSSRYYLSRSVVALGQAAQRNFGLNLALPVLESVAEASGEAVNLAVRDGEGAIVLFRVESRHPLRMDQPPGTRLPLHCTASGKALLAFSPQREQILKTLPRPLPKFTATTITNLRNLRLELKETLKRGYSLDNEESVRGVCCIGTGVLDERQHSYAAIAVQIPVSRVPEQGLSSMASLIMDAAGQMASVLPPAKLA